MVYLHCQKGRSRSSSVAIAYAMHRNGLSLLEAFHLVSRKRCITALNYGFFARLVDFERSLLLKKHRAATTSATDALKSEHESKSAVQTTMSCMLYFLYGVWLVEGVLWHRNSPCNLADVRTEAACAKLTPEHHAFAWKKYLHKLTHGAMYVAQELRGQSEECRRFLKELQCDSRPAPAAGDTSTSPDSMPTIDKAAPLRVTGHYWDSKSTTGRVCRSSVRERAQLANTGRFRSTP